MMIAAIETYMTMLVIMESIILVNIMESVWLPSDGLNTPMP